MAGPEIMLAFCVVSRKTLFFVLTFIFLFLLSHVWVFELRVHKKGPLRSNNIATVRANDFLNIVLAKFVL